jgi:exonuclease VII large subunit
MNKPNQSTQFLREELSRQSKAIEEKIKEQTEDKKENDEVILERWKKIEAILETEGFKIIIQHLKEEQTMIYQQMANGTKEKFDEYKGILKGLSYLDNLLNIYRAKIKKIK